MKNFRSVLRKIKCKELRKFFAFDLKEDKRLKTQNEKILRAEEYVEMAEKLILEEKETNQRLNRVIEIGDNQYINFTYGKKRTFNKFPICLFESGYEVGIRKKLKNGDIIIR